MVPVLLSIGSNIDKEKNVSLILDELVTNDQLRFVRRSRIYETVALGSDGKPSTQTTYFNLAVRVDTDFSASALVCYLRQLEAKQGRIRSAEKFAPRPIDLDIAFYGLEPFAIEGYQFPDPAIARFPHLACPLAEIAPRWRIPIAVGNQDNMEQHITLRMLSKRLLQNVQLANQIIRIIEFDELGQRVTSR